jgi:hypothetical protein
MSFNDYIKRIVEKDAEILKNLGSDFDEEGIPYWEKWSNKETKLEFTDIKGVWHWRISKDNYAYSGYSDNLEDAEKNANEQLNKISSAGVVHTIYNPGKPVARPTMTWEEEGKAMGFISIDKDDTTVVE